MREGGSKVNKYEQVRGDARGLHGGGGAPMWVGKLVVWVLK